MIVGIYTLYSVGILLSLYILWLIFTLAMAESQTSDRILLEVILKTGRTKEYWAKYRDQQVTVEGTKEYKGEIKTWIIGDSNTIEGRYPNIPLIPNFLKRQVRRAIVYEWSAEPIIKRADCEPVISPLLLGVVRMTGIAAAISATTQEVMKAIQNLGQMLKPSHFYIGMGILALGIFVVYLKVKAIPNMEEMITRLDLIIKLLGGTIPTNVK